MYTAGGCADFDPRRPGVGGGWGGTGKAFRIVQLIPGPQLLRALLCVTAIFVVFAPSQAPVLEEGGW